MAEHAILNPVIGTTPGTNDNYNPDYGFTRKTAANSQIAKSRLGSWYQRDTLNAGYAFDLQWIARPWTTMLRIKQFYEDFKGGYFTYIDWDAGGRHHVGRFTSAPNPVPVANGKYNLQGMTFEEIPQARMLQYPADFLNWSRTINVLDDMLLPAVATQGVAWGYQLNPLLPNPNPNDPNAYEYLNTSGIAGAFAQIQYVGWGFKMVFRGGALLGRCNVVVDGAVYLANVDQSVFQIIENTQMPLDMHRVKIVTLGMAGAQGGGQVIFPQTKVIV